MSDRTKFRTYANTNSETSVHPMYTNVSVTINEHDRIAASRLRLSSHSLAIETGRWSRVPRERRLCSCGEVQTEQHVVWHCPRTIHVRERHHNLNFTHIGSFFIIRTFLPFAGCHPWSSTNLCDNLSLLADS